MDDLILEKIRRIYAAIGSIEEDDPHKLKATLFQTDTIKAVFQDFRGGLSIDDLSNQAHSVIHNIANLHDHLCRWARHHGQNTKRVDDVIDSSIDLKLIKDLSNNDKHGYPPRDSGHSKRSPQLIEINRVMRLQTQAKQGSTIGLILGPGGVPKFFGDGNAKAVVTGDVVDSNGEQIGDLYEIVGKAIEAWEALLKDFGLLGATDLK